MTEKPLLQLFADFPLPFEIHGSPQGVVIRRVVFDSRLVQKGDLFVALPGVSSDGHKYIPAAIEKGAVAVLGSLDLSLRVPFIKVDNTRAAMAYLSAALEGWPARSLTVIGVTGTDGKTTTSSLIHRILLQAGLKAGMISTVNAVIGDEVLDTGFHVTTPDSPDLQRYLRRMVDAGLTHVVLEATSHGLAQDRVTACEFDIGVVTNITHEHLDYHGSYEEYRAAKGRLFTMLSETREKKQGNPRLAVLNRDDGSYEYLHALAQVRQVSYGLGGEADLTASQIRYERGRMSLPGAHARDGHRPGNATRISSGITTSPTAWRPLPRRWRGWGSTRLLPQRASPRCPGSRGAWSKLTWGRILPRSWILPTRPTR